jgi:V/A-type H+-transporting ATPase subunit E
VEDILESARKDADQLKAAAEKEKKAILGQANESISGRKVESEKRLAESIRRLKQQEISSAELEAKRIVLNSKKEVLDQTFEETLKDLARLGDADKSRIYSKIMSQGVKVIPQPRVYCPRGEGHLISSLPGVGSVQEMDMGPGLVLESKDGLVLLDYKFKTILEGVWEKELKNVSNVLFG